MASSLCVIGVSAAGDAPVFCYAQVRSVRANDCYPPLNLPRAARAGTHVRRNQFTAGVELTFWERVLASNELTDILGDLRSGAIQLPADCPITAGKTLSGPTFPRLLIADQSAQPLLVSGAGEIVAEGFVVPAVAAETLGVLQKAKGAPEVGVEALALTQAIDRALGYGGRFAAAPRFGAVDHLTRRIPDAQRPLFTVAVVKPDLRGSEPCREVILTRSADFAALGLMIVLKAKSFGNTIAHRLLIWPSTAPELRVDVGSHVTDVEVQTFAEDGDILLGTKVAFTQFIQLNLTALGSVDVFPPPFKSAPASPDLTHRPRKSSTATKIEAGDRAPAINELIRGARLLEVFAGKPGHPSETRFFQPGPDAQLEVIRWMKKKLEDPNTTEAFLIDPYLGTQAFERIVLRHGNENVKLTIVISPAGVDPDAETMDVAQASGSHVDQLVDAVERLSAQLCGEVTLIQVERGRGGRQAFHDRFLGLVGRDGAPQVFLLSNSLSKAAGDWPFTIAELARPTAWEIAGYVRGLIDVSGNTRELSARVVWRSPREGREVGTSQSLAVTPFASALWTAYLALFNLKREDAVKVRSIAALLSARFPAEADVSELGRTLVEGMHGRLHLAVALASAYAETAEHGALANAVDEVILKQVIDELAPDRPGAPPMLLKIAVLKHAGHTLARAPAASNRIRDQLNPLLQNCLTQVEIGREGNRAIAALHSGLGIVIVGLVAAQHGSSWQPMHRIGMVSDYIYALGRLMRSSQAAEWYGRHEIVPAGSGLPNAAWNLAQMLASELQGAAQQAIDLVSTDPLIDLDVVQGRGRPPEWYEAVG